MEYFKSTGSFVAHRMLPGTYSATVELSDEFFGAATFGVPDFPSNVPADVEILRVVRMTSPLDSRMPLPPWETPPPFHGSPFRLEWDPVPGADRYHWSVWHKEPGKGEGADVTGTSAEIRLSPGEYTFHVIAYEKNKMIATSRFLYENWPNQSYRFRVPPR